MSAPRSAWPDIDERGACAPDAVGARVYIAGACAAHPSIPGARIARNAEIIDIAGLAAR